MKPNHAVRDLVRNIVRFWQAQSYAMTFMSGCFVPDSATQADWKPCPLSSDRDGSRGD